MKNLFDGLRVVDFTSNAAGPVSTGYLADFGAEIIKVEKPVAGDDMRSFPPDLHGTGLFFFWPNRGKKSLVLDMADPEGREIALKLIEEADIVVESFKPGTMENFGLGYEDLRKVNPAIIMCSVSAFGQTGPHSPKPGYDVVAQALSGIMDLTGDPSGPPTRSGVVLADYTTGIYAYAAIVSALYHRERTGKGQHVDIALLIAWPRSIAISMWQPSAENPPEPATTTPFWFPLECLPGTMGASSLGPPIPNFGRCSVMSWESVKWQRTFCLHRVPTG